MSFTTPDCADTSLRDRTIQDFGDQWSSFQENRGYYGSTELLQDIIGPLMGVATLRGATMADIGSGSGRIVRMLLQAGAAHVTAVEPAAKAFDVLQRNLADATNVTLCNIRGDELPAGLNLDHVVSFGVLHHIPDPTPVVKACLAALRPGGQFTVWLYGREGNETYLLLTRPLRGITTRLPHTVLVGLCHVLWLNLYVYDRLCRALPKAPLPLANYLANHYRRLARDQQILTIYDQLNPACAHYYTREQARSLLTDNGFVDVALHHRHVYSWTVTGRKPLERS